MKSSDENILEFINELYCLLWIYNEPLTNFSLGAQNEIH